MGVFKNEVGRPSNKTLKTRKILIGSFAVLFIGVIAIGTNYINSKNNSKNLKGASLQLVEWDTSGVYFDHNEITKTDNSVTIKEEYYMYGDVYNSKSKKAGYDRIINDDDVNYIEKNLNKIVSSNNSLIKKLSDVNHDGKVDKTDVNLIKRMSNNQSKIYGDLDGDKQITYKDKKLLYNYLNGKKVLKISQRKLADIDGNGKVNKTDYELMLYKPAYVYCLTLESDISKAKKSCTWYQAGKIDNLDGGDYRLYRKDLSNDEVRRKNQIYIAGGTSVKTIDEIREERRKAYIKSDIDNFSSHDFGKMGVYTGKGFFYLESSDSKKFVFSNGNNSYELIDTITKKTIFDPSKDETFELKANKTYYLKLVANIDGKKIQSKTVTIRLINDGTYMKNAVIGKKAEVLSTIRNNNTNLTLIKNAKYQYLSLIDSGVDKIIIPKGFDFSNVESGGLHNGGAGYREIKIVNKTGKKADWNDIVLDGASIDNKKTPLECEFVTGVCEFYTGSSTNGTPNMGKIIVTDK